MAREEIELSAEDVALLSRHPQPLKILVPVVIEEWEEGRKMDSNETREFVTTMLANVLSDKSVLAPHVAREFAEAAVTELLAAEFLITDGKIYSVMEVSGTDTGDEECEAFTVYTYADPYEEDEETFPSETEYHEHAGVDEDGVHYEKGE